MSNSLITQRKFLPYFCTQFLGAFNDNLYKNALAILITYRLVVENDAILQNVALVAFIAPFLMFGSTAGQLADKYEKSWLIRNIKLAEIVIMILGCVALYLKSVELMLAILFLLGTQSAFFGPIKYSILPQHLERNEILGANGYVEAGTFVAILLGTIIGGFLGGRESLEYPLMVALVAIALLGWFTSQKIPDALAASPELKVSLNVWQSTKKIINLARANRPVYLAILAISWFWFFASIVLTQFPTFASQVLYGDYSAATLLLATFTIGIAAGSMTCSKLSGGRVEIGLMPLGALGISFFTWQLSTSMVPPAEELRTLMEMLATDGTWWVILNMTMIAFCSGMFIVPLYAFIQIRTEEGLRSRMFAVNNILNSIFMVVAGGLAALMLYLDFTVLQIFKVAAILNFIVTLYIISVVPHFVLRLIGWLLIHSVYRIKKQDLHHIPEEGPALVVCNHVSFVDPIILLALSPRPARFVMYYSFYELPIIKWVFKSLRSIPIATKRDRPEMLEQAMNSIAESLDDGHLVFIFPEGGITKNGEIAKFQPGMEKILKRNPVPVVPVALKGMWGTWFSRHRGRAMKGMPRRFMSKISVISGPPVPAEEADRIRMFDKVVALRGDER